MRRFPTSVMIAILTAFAWPAQADVTVRAYPVPSGAHPHDVAPDPGGGAVWYTAQHQGALGRLDPATGEIMQIPLGQGSRPYGVIVGPGGHAWVTDSGLNAIVSVDPGTLAVTRRPLPKGSEYANLNTATFDAHGVLWFTGQSGISGRFDPASGSMEVFKAPRGYGPYGIDATPGGEVWYASLRGSYIGHVKTSTGEVEVVDPPLAGGYVDDSLPRVLAHTHRATTAVPHEIRW